MINKKYLLIAPVLLLLLSSVAFAQPMPKPVTVKLSAELNGVTIEIKNMNTGQVVSMQTNQYGEIAADGNAIFTTLSPSDIVEAKVLVCASNPQCVQQQMFGDAVFFQFDVSGMPISTTTTVAAAPICAPTDIVSIIGYIVTFLAGLGAAKYGLGMKVYTNTSGVVVKQHKHKNVTSYHLPEVMHKIQPHKKGEMFPKYSTVKNKDGQYDYLG